MIIPKHLRVLFIALWDAKFPNQLWKNNATSGQELYSKIPQNFRQHMARSPGSLQQMILAGSCKSWNPTVLFFLLLHSRIYIIGKCRPFDQRSPPLIISENIDRLRRLRSIVFSYAVNKSVSDDEFKTISAELLDIVSEIFGTAAKDEIDQVLNFHAISELPSGYISKLEEENKFNNDVSEWMVKLNAECQGMECFLLFQLCFLFVLMYSELSF